MGAEHIWAKTGTDPTGTLTHWLPLPQHMADSGAAAEHIWDRHLPQHIRDNLTRHLGPNARAIVAALAAVHDIGKATPAFQEKNTYLADRARHAGYPIPPLAYADELPHGLAGHIILHPLFAGPTRAAKKRATGISVIIGGHHGTPPTHPQIRRGRGLTAEMGTGTWDTVRDELLTPYLPTLHTAPKTMIPAETQTIISGIVIIADWIASNSTVVPLFPIGYIPAAGYNATALAQGRIASAWESLKMMDSNTLPPLPPDWDTRFDQIFGFPPGAKPNTLQTTVHDIVATATSPGMLIIEAPMGIGKTEAALIAAQTLSNKTNTGGVLFALPTRATSNALFPRLHAWTDNLLTTIPNDQSLALAHAKNKLYDPYQKLPKPKILTDDGCGHGQTVANSWLAGRKKTLLNPFVVGTIDQILMAGQKQRHVVLRHLGLTGKTVIIDEVHAYDQYMYRYLTTVISWLAAYNIPVIVLSATLPPSMRQQLIDAYKPGTAPITAHGYPRIEWVPLDGTRTVDFTPPPPSATINLTRLDDDDTDIEAFLRHKLRDGGCAVVIRNTVKRAQATAKHLTDVFGKDVVSVAHSRYTAADRQKIDDGLVAKFGKTGTRPELAIVVATQVVEQSLDIDFDVMVTDISPIDLLLQRAGRLHRHSGRIRPAPVSEPVLAVCGVRDWAVPVPRPSRTIPNVYSNWLLLRTLFTLSTRSTITIPDDIEPFVTWVYDGPPIPDPDWAATEIVHLAAHNHTQAGKKHRASHFLLASPKAGLDLVGWLDASAAPADAHAAVRDGDDALEILLLQRNVTGGVGVPHWMPSVPDLNTTATLKWSDVKTISRSALSIPAHLIGNPDLKVLSTDLAATAPPVFATEPMLDGEPVATLNPSGEVTINGHHFLYTQRYGLEEI